MDLKVTTEFSNLNIVESFNQVVKIAHEENVCGMLHMDKDGINCKFNERYATTISIPNILTFSSADWSSLTIYKDKVNVMYFACVDGYYDMCETTNIMDFPKTIQIYILQLLVTTLGLNIEIQD